MRILKNAIALLIIACMILPAHAGKCETVSGVFRLHIIANSDSFNDQRVKYAVRNALMEFENRVFTQNPVSNAAEAKSLLMDNACFMQSIIDNTLKDNDVEYSAQMKVGIYEFPQRVYNDVVFEAGEYEALRVILGDGNGKNWWCVMFPPLCITYGDSGQIDENGQRQTEQAKSLVIEFFEWVAGLFS